VGVNDNTKNIQLEVKLKQLEDCTIKAPCDGTITARNIEAGGFPSGTLFKIQDLNNIYINVTVKEVNVPDIKVGQKAKIRTDSLKNETIEGEVLSIEPVAKSESNDALGLNDDSIDKEAEYNAKIKMNELSDKVNVGMKAKVNIILEEKEGAYIISSNSIVNNNDSHSIYAAEKQDKKYVIKEIPVSLGTEGDSDIEIIGEGLYDGIIVINDPMKYEIGQVINIKKDL
jgi:multidrug efflux pump subunit AcrA (membrane-fusion protein)